MEGNQRARVSLIAVFFNPVGHKPNISPDCSPAPRGGPTVKSIDNFPLLSYLFYAFSQARLSIGIKLG